MVRRIFILDFVMNNTQAFTFSLNRDNVHLVYILTQMQPMQIIHASYAKSNFAQLVPPLHNHAKPVYKGINYQREIMELSAFLHALKFIHIVLVVLEEYVSNVFLATFYKIIHVNFVIIILNAKSVTQIILLHVYLALLVLSDPK